VLAVLDIAAATAGREIRPKPEPGKSKKSCSIFIFARFAETTRKNNCHCAEATKIEWQRNKTNRNLLPGIYDNSRSAFTPLQSHCLHVA